MKREISLVIVLFIVFFIGFLSGSLWQTLLQNHLQIPAGQPMLITSENSEKTIEPKQNDSIKISSVQNVQKMPIEEEKISQALSDPDFKKVHDFLIRENPIQMNIENKK